jgi:hypothetical protein
MTNHPNRKKTAAPLHWRQGDVLLVATDRIPADAAPVGRDEHNRLVLANGEVTGHAHVFRGKGICGFTKLDNKDIEYLLVETGGGSGATLKHELVSGAKADHDPQQIPDGKYLLGQQVEYTPAELIRASD